MEARVDPGAYARASEVALVLTVPAGAPAEQAVDRDRTGGDWPLVLTPRPE